MELVSHNICELSTSFSSFITANEHMHSIFRYLFAVASSKQPLLITGESGVGKGVIAKAFGNIARHGKPFVSVNIAGLDSQVFSDTLFGHIRGAYTGAETKRSGIIGQAADGIVFMDEIGELSMQSQLKLLYLLQEGEYQRLGSDEIMVSNARFIFATNQDLEAKTESGAFRKDLLYRLNTHRVHIPPLRERTEDIPLLIKYFVKEAAMECDLKEPSIDDEAIAFLQNYKFPGNIRQLRSIIYDAVLQSKNRLGICDVRAQIKEEYRHDDNFDILCRGMDIPTVDEAISLLIHRAMAVSGGNQTKAAALIGLSQSTLSRRLKQ